MASWQCAPGPLAGQVCAQREGARVWVGGSVTRAEEYQTQSLVLVLYRATLERIQPGARLRHGYYSAPLGPPSRPHPCRAGSSGQLLKYLKLSATHFSSSASLRNIISTHSESFRSSLHTRNRFARGDFLLTLLLIGKSRKCRHQVSSCCATFRDERLI